MTYSIVARDDATGQMGVAVQSHYFGTGTVVTWAESGVGVVATQAFAEPSYGPLGLDLMRDGVPADQALAQLLEKDAQFERRQVAMVDANNVVGAHTGASTLAEAGHLTGDGFSVQANMMLRDTVPTAMADAFTSATGDLAYRLLAALDAAEAQGGDIRGRQSAAMLVVGAEPAEFVHEGTLFDLRVDDHADPLRELRRILSVKRAYNYANDGAAKLLAGDEDGAVAAYTAARDSAPGNPEFIFWRGVVLAGLGRIDEAKTFLEETYAAPMGDWRELLRRLPDIDMLPKEVADQLL